MRRGARSQEGATNNTCAKPIPSVDAAGGPMPAIWPCVQFVQRLLGCSAKLPAGSTGASPTQGKRGPDPSAPPNLWREWHASKWNAPTGQGWSHHSWPGSLTSDPQRGALLWCALNAYSKAIHFDLPKPSEGWLRVIDHQPCPAPGPAPPPRARTPSGPAGEPQPDAMVARACCRSQPSPKRPGARPGRSAQPPGQPWLHAHRPNRLSSADPPTPPLAAAPFPP